MEQDNQLEKSLSSRQIALITLGSTIGTGLFLSINSSLSVAGPSILLGYLVVAVFIFLMMRQLGEMLVEKPTSGSFAEFGYQYLGRFAGFFSGWMSWLLYLFVGMVELSAIAIYVKFWFPEVPNWIGCLFFFVLINLINFTSAKSFGTFEVWFSAAKIFAVLAMVFFGGYLLFFGKAGDQASVANLWNKGGFFSFGLFGFLASLSIIVFSFGGLEMIGFASAETKNPKEALPKAINGMFLRMLFFYLGAIFVLLALCPWQEIINGKEGSPFVLIFSLLPSQFSFSLFGYEITSKNLIANFLNLIILIAALSVYNRSVFCCSRVLYALSQQNNAPKSFSHLSSKKVPQNAMIFSSIISMIGILVNFFFAENSFHYLLMLVVSVVLTNWFLISFTHLVFKRKINKQTDYPALFSPFSNYLCMAFFVFILGIMWITGMKVQVLLLPIFSLIMYILFRIYKKN